LPGLFRGARLRLRRRFRALLSEADQLDVEAQRRAGLDDALRLLAVGDLARAHQVGLAAGLHLLDRLGSARDQAIELELRGLSALARAVEHASVAQLALVMDGHQIGRS